jgi:hypothetical protein
MGGSSEYNYLYRLTSAEGFPPGREWRAQLHAKHELQQCTNTK